MQQPEPQSRNLDAFLHEIDKGAVKIPLFQRDFVWDRDKSVRLLDSVLKGYPVGTFILWKTKERMRSVRDIGGVHLPELPAGDPVEQVLDGQQRLTSLYAAVNGLKIERGKRTDDFSEIVLDLDADPEGTDPLVLPRIPGATFDPAGIEVPVDPDRFAPLSAMRDGVFLQVLQRLSPARQQRLNMLKSRLSQYRFSLIVVPDATLATATEIFTRINVSGKPLTVFEIMVAKTYNEEDRFDLADRFARLTQRLAEVGYGTLPGVSMLQLTCLILRGAATRDDILDLPSGEFSAAWDQAESAARSAVDHFRTALGIPVSRLLPYASLVVPFGFFFHLKPDGPDAKASDRLEEFFFRVALTGRYTSATETKLAVDAKLIASIAAGEDPAFDASFACETSAESIDRRGVFRTSRSYVKALLAVLAAQQPLSFRNNASVELGNDWLKRANSRNYHHFFPKAFLRKQGVETKRANHVANITLVDDHLNKKVIKARPPSDYLADLRAVNDRLSETLQTHLIEDGDELRVDDYEAFLQKRCRRLAEELGRRVPARAIDRGRSDEEDRDDHDPSDP